jgi:EAL domain-containing protein (putative c-di-GMP-specific phosphodiesterase class I)
LREVSAALIGLGRALGLRVAAKGVEDADVAQFMQAQGCDEAQGFHFARPMLGPDVELWSLARNLAQHTTPR